jgi:hypothetical protein
MSSDYWRNLITLTINAFNVKLVNKLFWDFWVLYVNIVDVTNVVHLTGKDMDSTAVTVTLPANT